MTTYQYPPFLLDYGSLLSHFNIHFTDLNSAERGETFVQFVRRLVPHTPIGERFEKPYVRQRSHDQGVDLTAEGKNQQEILFVQSKYTIRDVDEIDRIISKFDSYHKEYTANQADKKNKPEQIGLFTDNSDSANSKSGIESLHFMVVTTSDLSGILPRYEQSKRPSLGFYQVLIDNKRLHIFDGPKLLPLLQNTYRKLHIIPTNFELSFAKDYTRLGDVFIGIVSGLELKRLYDEFGDALFIENIREFLGSIGDRSSLTDVNKDILTTLEKEPERFLAKNNGITFRSAEVTEISTTTLKLSEASIVNGLQTTVSIIQQPSDQCYVLVKIVGSEHSWEIAKAANFQNKIDRIDLDLAEYIRPRYIRTSASRAGIGFRYLSNEASQGDDDFNGNVFAVLDIIYNDQVSYQEIRSLFIGIFSRNPNNTIDPDYNQLRTDIIEQIYRDDPKGDSLFAILFKIQKLIQQGADEAQRVFQGRSYSDVFHRFWEQAKPNYRAFLSILAMCGSVRENPYERDGEVTYPQMMNFLEKVADVVENNPNIFIRYFRHAFKTVATQIIGQGNERDITLQKMYRSMHRAKFTPLYIQVCINADDDDYLQNANQKEKQPNTKRS